MKNFRLVYIFLLLVFQTFTSCKRSLFLDIPPNQSQVIPQTLEDFQALLDNDNAMNGTGSGLVPALGIIGADNYYPAEKYFAYVPQSDFNIYIWNPDPYPGESLNDWNYPYLSALYCNIVLDGLKRPSVIKRPEEEYNNLVGSALFYRAHVFYQLAQVFAPPYDSTTSDKDPGIPLKLTADILQKTTRPSVEQTYNQIIQDLKRSCDLLPVKPLIKTRPSKAAGYGLLARVYQTMENYTLALKYADSCLALSSSLMNFNNLDSMSPNPIPRFNDEVIFDCTISISHIIGRSAIMRIDSNLYNSFETNDLRRVVLFDMASGLPGYKGSYYGFNQFLFGGIATDEIYLVKAECLARLGNITEAMKSLNALLETRWRSGTFIPYSAGGTEDALKQILTERRKELVLRGFRWTDLRRLNKDSHFKKILKKVLKGEIYTLSPGDLRYTWPIPDDILSFNPEMKQNIR